MLQTYKYLFSILLTIAVPVAFNLFITDQYTAVWTLLIIPALITVIAFPSWRVVFPVLFLLSGIKYLTEFVIHGGSIPFEGLMGLLVNTVVNWVVFIAMSYFRIKSEQISKALEGSEMRYRQLFELSPEMIAIHKEGKLIFINQAGVDLLGARDSQEVIGISLGRLAHPDYHLLLKERASKVQKVGRIDNMEYKIIRLDGQVRDIEVSSTLIDYAGKVAILSIARDITEKKQTEQALRSSEQRFRSLFEYNPAAVYSLDAQGKFTSINPSGLTLSGYTEEELLGSSFVQLLVPEEVDKVVTLFKKSFSNKINDYKTAIYHKSGERKEIHVITIPIMVDGKMTGRYGIALDITKESQFRRQLQAVKEELELVWEHTHDAIFLIASDGSIIRSNPAFKSMLGHASSELIGISAASIIPEHFKEDQQLLLERIQKGEVITNHEVQRINKQGQLLDILASYHPILDKQGQLLFVVATYRDITEEKKAQKKLAESEERYRFIAENSSDVIMILQADGVISYVSPSVKPILGYTPAECVGKHFMENVYEEDQKFVLEQFKKLELTKQPCALEIRRLAKSGEVRWHESRGTPVVDNKGQIQNILIVARDVSDRKKWEEKLRHLAYHDALTGLPNRRLFQDRLTQTIHQANRSGKKVAVLSLDCDRFKQINDTYGHDVGDAVIIEFAKRLNNCLRASDTVCRLGGDEFQILLTLIESPNDIIMMAERILDKIREPMIFNELELTISTSIGIAVYPENAKDIASLLKRSDEALYQAKEAGRNTYHLIS